MAMNWTERGLRKAGDGDLAKIVVGVREAYIKRHPGQKDIAFPQPKESKNAQSIASETPQPRPLEPKRFTIEIPIVSEEVYAETRRAVEATGAFITSIRSVSIEDLLAEDGQRELRGESRRLGYVNDSKTMRSTVPPNMEVFINPMAVRIEGSNYLSTDEQKTKIAQVEARFKERLLEAVRPFVGLHMVDHSTMSQLEDAWMDAGSGLLLPDFFARTDVQTVEGYVAYVGRYHPTHQRGVDDWHRDAGADDVFAVPVGVLPRKLTA